MAPGSDVERSRIERGLRGLKARDEGTVLRAVHRLAGMGAAVLPALTGALDDRDCRLRCGAARALGYLRDRTSVPLLLAALADGDTGVREATAQSLGWLGDESALSPLIEALHDPNEDVREKAAVALRDIGSVGALPALQAALDDESHWVRRAARKSIFKLQELASEESLSPRHSAAVPVTRRYDHALQ